MLPEVKRKSLIGSIWQDLDIRNNYRMVEVVDHDLNTGATVIRNMVTGKESNLQPGALRSRYLGKRGFERVDI